ncbi:reverse transcriptase domain-containing protein [Tanacetum coccineum]
MEVAAVVGGVEARGSEWIWGSGRSGHEDNIWFRPERSPENFSGGDGVAVAGIRSEKMTGGGRRKIWEREEWSLPTVTAPVNGETLIVYLEASEESISAVLMAERGKKQVHVYFVNRTLHGAELEYPELESSYWPSYMPQESCEDIFKLTPSSRNSPKKDREIKDGEAKTKEPEPENAWKLFTDRSSSSDGSGAGFMLVNLEGKEYTYALRFEFKTTNNEAEYEALLAGLPIAKEMKIQERIIFVDSQLVANQVNGLFEVRQPVIKQYLEKEKELLASFPTYSIEHIKRDQNKKADALSKLASMTFSKLAKEVLVEVLQEKSITQKEIADVTQEEEDNWMIHIREFLQLGKLPDDPQKARKLRIKAPLHKLLDGMRYRRSYLSPWLRCVGAAQAKNIIQEVKVTNKEIVKGMEHRFGKPHQGWVDELPQVLWAHRTTPKSSNRETPLSLVYGSEAVIPIEISVETRRIQDFDPKKNEKRRREDLDILKERREIASIKEARYKQKLGKYYNKRVRQSTFKPGTYVL